MKRTLMICKMVGTFGLLPTLTYCKKDMVMKREGGDLSDATTYGQAYDEREFGGSPH